MKVIRIQGTKEDSKLVQEILEEFLCYNPVFIINKDKELYKFIEELNVDDNYLYVLRVAKEIEFGDLPVELEDKSIGKTLHTRIDCFSRLIEELDENSVDSLQLIMDTEDKDIVSDVIQSLIYLNINLEVIMRKEKRDREIVNAFRNNFFKIENSVVQARNSIEDIEVIDKLLPEKETVLKILRDVETDLDKAKERELNIAVMATKKAGKSVVVNSFLDEQYAPTSFELPTPNTCIYKKSSDDKIHMVYAGQTMSFDSPEEIYKYTYEEFKKAQNDSERDCSIEDMEIHYASNKNDFAAFTVVDTPGPNYAGAKNSVTGENMHKKSAYQWISRSDVVLFLINYSNYLSSDEEQFFRDIKSEFEKHDKFYSLVVVVNKLDEIYMSECENKSVVRFLDYVRCRLNALGYKGFIILGTSARTYFDVVKISRIDHTDLAEMGEKEGAVNLKGDALRGRLKKLKRKYIGKSNMTVLSFVDDQLEKLECFHGLENAALDTLKIRSGIPKLKEYTTYIAIQKANTELYASLIRNIDEKFVRLRNMDLIKSLIASKTEKQDQIEVLEAMLNKMVYTFESIESEVNKKLNFYQIENGLENEMIISKKTKIQEVSEIYEDRIKEFFMKLRYMDSEQLGNLKNTGINIDFSVGNKLIEDEFDRLLSSFLSKINEDLDKKERYLREFDERIKELVYVFSENVKKEYDLSEFNIEVPKIEHAFNRNAFVKIPHIDFNDIIKEKVLDSIDFKQNILEKIISNFVDKKLGTYVMDGDTLTQIKNYWLKLIRQTIGDEYTNSYRILAGNCSSSIDDLKIQIGRSSMSLTSTYKDIFRDILKDLSSRKTDAEEQMKYLDAKLLFLNEIQYSMCHFTDAWRIIRSE